MKQHLISIIVPVYNTEKYLKQCINSILKQTYSNLEILIVNDGSTDNSDAVCRDYESIDKRIFYINKKNEGLSSARQMGINKAQGKYFCTIDSDDYVEINYIKNLYEKIEKENSDICVCGIREHKGDQINLKGFESSIISPKKIKKEDAENDYINLLKPYYMSDSWNKMYRTQFVKNTNIKFTLDKTYNGTDLLFNHLLLLHLPSISVINDYLYNYRVLENSRVRRKNKKLQQGFLIILDKIIEEVNKKNFSFLIYTQLSTLYLIFLRDAAQDELVNESNAQTFNKKISDFYQVHKKYLIKNPEIKVVSKNLNTFSLKVFNYSLKNIYLLKGYLLLRKKMLKL